MVKFWLWIKQTGLTVRLINHQENFYKRLMGSSPQKLCSQDWRARWHKETRELGWVRDSQVRLSGQGKSVNLGDTYDQRCAGAGQPYSVELVGKINVGIRTMVKPTSRMVPSSQDRWCSGKPRHLCWAWCIAPPLLPDTLHARTLL